MPEKETIILLLKVLSPQNEKKKNKFYIETIIEEEIPVLCVNINSKKKRLMPFKVLYDNNEHFWEQEGDWKYYLTGEDYNNFKEKIAVKPDTWDIEKLKQEKIPEIKTEDAEPEKPKEPEEEETGLGSEYETFVGMPAQKMVEHLDNDKNRLNELLAQKTRDTTEVTKALVDTAKNVALINHAAIEEAIIHADDEAKKLTQDVVNSTNELVKSSAQLISENIFSNELMNALVGKSNGTIIQHMTRVYLNGIAFLSFYNNLVSGSSYIQKLRISFASKYRNFYHKLLPHMSIDEVILEHVFYGGMRAIPPAHYFKWAVGFLIHDIGKASAVEYHEGESSYDRNIVIDHVKQGYKSIVNKTNYPREASLITGYHHEYYGDPNGYGYFRSYLEQYKKANPKAKQDYCITYDPEPILDCHALAYFPAKILEIVDIFDSVTDPHRVYRKSMSTKEALDMMHEEFIEKHVKIDAILFDIFTMFITEKEIQEAKTKAKT